LYLFEHLLFGTLVSMNSQPLQPRNVEHLNSPEFVRLGLPFSAMVRVGEMLYLSGQIGTLPGTLTPAPGGIQAEALQAMDNIRTSLQAHGYSMAHIIKCTVMLADMNDWAAFNTVYTRFFTPPYPARNAFAANGLALGARLEIDVIATTRL
jgi:reactive intermediate/imine deaminase